MSVTIAEFGEMRLKKVLEKDKKQNPKRVKEILRSDIKKILRDFVDLESDEIEIEFIDKEEGFKINITADAKRVKPVV